MRNIIGIISIGLFLTGCMSNSAFHLGEGQEVVQTLSVTKQKQRITLLQKKLENAERELKNVQDEVDHLHSELHQSQLALIAKQIENYELQMRKIQTDPSRLVRPTAQEEKLAPFLKEREMLQHMMENGPSPQAFEAQIVLDRILRMITEIRDVEESSR